MKILALIIAGLIILNLMTDAQYSINKTKYDLKAYHYQYGDPFNPGVMGFASFVIPGLGQILEGETARGFGFFGGFVGLNIIKYRIRKRPFSGSFSNVISLNTVRWVLGGLHLWSLFDAIHVAKVNNMVFRDQVKTTFNFQLLPYVGSYDYFKFNNEVSVGLTLLINFQ
jgi:uncharacterized membrane protein YsdA (DUF1294 family)